MLWKKTKVVVAALAVVLVVGLTVMLVLHHAHQYKGRSHFPKSSWTSAGFSDPVSALETACWASVQGDGKTMLASIAPELQKPLTKAWKASPHAKEMTLEEFFAEQARKPLAFVLGFRVLGEQTVNEHQALVHVYIQGWWHKATFKMTKIGSDWRVAGITWK